jgi:hypothetical protein
MAETITFNVIGDYTYLIYVGEYLDKNNMMQPYIEDTGARLDFYIEGETSNGPVA